MCHEASKKQSNSTKKLDKEKQQGQGESMEQAAWQSSGTSNIMTPGSPLYKRKRSEENSVSHTLVIWFHRNHMVGTTMQPEMAIRDGSTENRVQWDLLF
jgi:hypothetical protein